MDLTTLCHVEGEKLADWFPSALCNVVLDEWPISDFFQEQQDRDFLQKSNNLNTPVTDVIETANEGQCCCVF